MQHAQGAESSRKTRHRPAVHVLIESRIRAEVFEIPDAGTASPEMALLATLESLLGPCASAWATDETPPFEITCPAGDCLDDEQRARIAAYLQEIWARFVAAGFWIAAQDAEVTARRSGPGRDRRALLSAPGLRSCRQPVRFGQTGRFRRSEMCVRRTGQEKAAATAAPLVAAALGALATAVANDGPSPSATVEVRELSEGSLRPELSGT